MNEWAVYMLAKLGLIEPYSYFFHPFSFEISEVTTVSAEKEPSRGMFFESFGNNVEETVRKGVCDKITGGQGKIGKAMTNSPSSQVIHSAISCVGHLQFYKQ